MPYLKAYAETGKQTDWLWIWIRIRNSISYDDNRYINNNITIH